MVNLSSILSELTPNMESADSRLMDARLHTEILVQHIMGLVKRMDQMDQEIEKLRAALEAVNTGDRGQIAYMAAQVKDADIQTLLRSPLLTKRSDLKTEVVIMISGHLGSLESWQRAYGEFATALFIQVSQVKSHLLALEGGRAMLEASGPLLQIQGNLGQAANALGLRSRPALRHAVRQALPADVHTAFLEG